MLPMFYVPPAGLELAPGLLAEIDHLVPRVGSVFTNS